MGRKEGKRRGRGRGIGFGFFFGSFFGGVLGVWGGLDGMGWDDYLWGFYGLALSWFRTGPLSLFDACFLIGCFFFRCQLVEVGDAGMCYFIECGY